MLDTGPRKTDTQRSTIQTPGQYRPQAALYTPQEEGFEDPSIWVSQGVQYSAGSLHIPNQRDEISPSYIQWQAQNNTPNQQPPERYSSSSIIVLKWGWLYMSLPKLHPRHHCNTGDTPSPIFEQESVNIYFVHLHDISVWNRMTVSDWWMRRWWTCSISISSEYTCKEPTFYRIQNGEPSLHLY